MLSFKNPSLFRACISSLADQTMLNYLLGVPPVERALWEYFQILSKISEHAENELSTFFFGGGFPKKQGFSIELSLLTVKHIVCNSAPVNYSTYW